MSKKTLHDKIPPHLWLVHGKLYDFENFLDKHPGGKVNLLVGRGRECTELFEGVHSLSDKNFKQIFEKYEVKKEDLDEEYRNINYEDFFDWSENGFYRTLTKKVRERFSGRNRKATTLYWGKLLLMVIIAVFCLKKFWEGSYFFAFLYGTMIQAIGFACMHDASHGAISQKAWINTVLSVIWNSWSQWSHWIWLQHHTYGHHSFTNIYLKDPDLVHFSIFLRKTDNYKGIWINKYQHYYWWFVVFIFPSQHYGQAFAYYIRNIMGNKLFGMPLTEPPTYLKRSETILATISFICHFIVPYYLYSFWHAWSIIMLLSIGQSLSYFLCVGPNHDTLITHNSFDEWFKSQNDKKVDWGELQLRSSANHSIKESWLNYFIWQIWGGMNFQIEHHLFPSVSHCHYLEISKIVQETSKEFNLPYPANETWLDSIKGYVQVVKLNALSMRK